MICYISYVAGYLHVKYCTHMEVSKKAYNVHFAAFIHLKFWEFLAFVEGFGYFTWCFLVNNRCWNLRSPLPSSSQFLIVDSLLDT